MFISIGAKLSSDERLKYLAHFPAAPSKMEIRHIENDSRGDYAFP